MESRKKPAEERKVFGIGIKQKYIGFAANVPSKDINDYIQSLIDEITALKGALNKAVGELATYESDSYLTLKNALSEIERLKKELDEAQTRI